MESAINNEYINSYSERFTVKIMDNYFQNKSFIDGEGILNLSEIRQINLFVIKNLMVNWKKESENLKSAYFNYKSPEVKNALQDFLNILSQNILITAKEFKPLLKKAVSDTLILLLSPYNYFSLELLSIGSPVNLAELSNRRKFIKINNTLYESFIKKIEFLEVDNIQIKEAKQYFDQVCEEISFSPEEQDEYISSFSKVLPFDIEKVYSEKEVEDIREEPNLMDEANSGEEKTTIHEQFYEEKVILADTLKNESSDSLLSFHQNQKIESIKKNISIHQKFKFVKELFDNNDNYFSEVIEHLDHCDSRDEAHNYLKENFLDNEKWQMDNETVNDFMSVFNKKFID